MKYLILLIAYTSTLCSNLASAQAPSPLFANSTLLSKDSFLTYKISFANVSDSIIVLEHSRFVDITETSATPLGLAAGGRKNDSIYYDLLFTWADTNIVPEHYPLSANFILPHQKIEFNIAMTPNLKKRCLIINYLLVYDIDYRTFLKTNGYFWERKFTSRKTILQLDK